MKSSTFYLPDKFPLPDDYYDPSATAKDFLIKDETDGWTRVNKATLKQELVRRGYSNEPKPFDGSEIDRTILAIQRGQSVDFVGKLAGWKKGLYHTKHARLLVTSSPVLIQPALRSWDMLNGVLTNMLGIEQRLYFFAWLKIALEALVAGRPRTGQALVLCGKAAAGKNLLRELITEILGGRVGSPFQFMTSNSSFNHDLFGAETLAIEDEAGSRSIQARQLFGAAIKNITANEDQRYHRKYGDPLTLRPFWRLIISLNDEPVRMLVLPPIEADIEDKLMLFKVTKHAMPMPTGTTAEREAFWAKLMKELPGFLHFLNGWQIPAELRDERYGVRHYHNKELLMALQELSPEDSLFELIDLVIFGPGSGRKPWIGKAEELKRDLLTNIRDPKEVNDLLPHRNSCGQYLGKLRDRYPERFSDVQINGRTRWTINPPDRLPTVHPDLLAIMQAATTASAAAPASDPTQAA